MATYTELYALRNDSGLRNRITVACFISADTIRQESTSISNHANRLLWAKKVYEDPETMGRTMLSAVLAANKNLTLTQFQNATDSQIQTAVDNAIDILANGA